MSVLIEALATKLCDKERGENAFKRLNKDEQAMFRRMANTALEFMGSNGYIHAARRKPGAELPNR